MSEDITDCICEGNWRLIVKETVHLLDRKFKSKQDRKDYTFLGIVHGSDDYYYGMCDEEGKISLLSCVASIEQHDFVLIER